MIGSEICTTYMEKPAREKARVEEHLRAFSRTGSDSQKDTLRMSALALAQLHGCFALTTSLRCLVVPATTRFSQNTCLLYFPTKLFQGDIKGKIRVDNNLAHPGYQRDRPASRRPWRG